MSDKVCRWMHRFLTQWEPRAGLQGWSGKEEFGLGLAIQLPHFSSPRRSAASLRLWALNLPGMKKEMNLFNRANGFSLLSPFSSVYSGDQYRQRKSYSLERTWLCSFQKYPESLFPGPACLPPPRLFRAEPFLRSSTGFGVGPEHSNYCSLGLAGPVEDPEA